MGTKSSDHDAADGCFHCHNMLDDRANGGYSTRQWIFAEFDRARLETIINRIERGVLR
jgi:hypothetical protein